MRWDWNKNKNVERPDVDLFLEEVATLCRKHGMSISHEDSHGAFIIEALSEENLDWLKDAMVKHKREKKDETD